ncbi:hypothetical protein ACLK2B_15460 [Escherichia coli]
MHGVYKPGNVKLTPSILDASQKFVSEKFGLPAVSGLRIPRWLRFHSGRDPPSPSPTA